MTSEEESKEKGSDSRTQIILAVVGLIGTVSVAIMANWDKFSASSKAASPTPSSTTSVNPALPTTPSSPTPINQLSPTTPSSSPTTESSSNPQHPHVHVDNTRWKVKYSDYLESSSGDWLFKKDGTLTDNSIVGLTH